MRCKDKAARQKREKEDKQKIGFCSLAITIVPPHQTQKMMMRFIIFITINHPSFLHQQMIPLVVHHPPSCSSTTLYMNTERARRGAKKSCFYMQNRAKARAFIRKTHIFRNGSSDFASEIQRRFFSYWSGQGCAHRKKNAGREAAGSGYRKKENEHAFIDFSVSFACINGKFFYGGFKPGTGLAVGWLNFIGEILPTSFLLVWSLGHIRWRWIL